MTEENLLEQPVKPRLHVALRIFLYLLASIIGMGIVQFTAFKLAGNSTKDLSMSTDFDALTSLLLELSGLIPVILITFVFRKYLDRKSFVSLGLSPKGRTGDFLLGLGVAITLYALGSGILALSGNIEFSNHGIGFQTLLISFVSFIGVAIMEELIVRGYILNNLLSVTNKYLALLISSAIFAAMHGFNPGLSWLAILNLLIAGVLLGAAYIFTRNLWFAMSLHLFWNFIEGPILGYRVSGNSTESLFSATPVGNPVLNGGEFGFEGSVVCTLLCIALALAIILYYQKKESKITA